MARQTVHAVVHVTINVRMSEVGRVIVAVARSARKHRVVPGVGVACCANTIRVPVVEREECVIARGQCGREPGCCGVAGCAGGRPARSSVVRIRGTGVVRLVAGVAIGWGARKHVVDVAEDASHRSVRARQRERRVVVVKGCAGPIGR